MFRYKHQAHLLTENQLDIRHWIFFYKISNLCIISFGNYNVSRNKEYPLQAIFKSVFSTLMILPSFLFTRPTDFCKRKLTFFNLKYIASRNVFVTCSQEIYSDKLQTNFHLLTKESYNCYIGLINVSRIHSWVRVKYIPSVVSGLLR